MTTHITIKGKRDNRKIQLQHSLDKAKSKHVPLRPIAYHMPDKGNPVMVYEGGGTGTSLLWDSSKDGLTMRF